MEKKKNSIKNRVMLENLMKNVFKENGQEFFSYAWRDKVKEFVEFELKYTQLLDWINERIEVEFNIINSFNPADKDDKYSKAEIKLYLSACQTVAVLLNAKEIITNDNCTTKMRENWEYTLCKLFDLSYNKEIGYVANVKK